MTGPIVWLALLSLAGSTNTGLAGLPPEGRTRIEAALPEAAPGHPGAPRRLLIFDQNVDYGGLASIASANHAFRRMGEETGAHPIHGNDRGRVFYCTIAHNPYGFEDSRMLEFYLAAAQFALGDLPGSVLPSAARDSHSGSVRGIAASILQK